jgi:hypothetical protein
MKKVIFISLLLCVLLISGSLLYFKPLTYRVWVGELPDPLTSRPRILLEIATLRQYGCMNFWINHTFSFEKNVIEVELLNVNTSGACLTAFGSAKLEEELPLTNGVYALEIHQGLITDRYRVTIAPTVIQLKSDNFLPNLISEPQVTQTARYPR